ncbi:MAG TPA: hypothetical protein VM347_00615 [Nonomuraea sp.]|nr:hypothetical protein [Nonomuraea sp.]
MGDLSGSPGPSWADGPSLELTEFLRRRPPTAGFLPAIACRSATIPPVAGDAVARLSLAPLDENAVASLMPAGVTSRPWGDDGRRSLSAPVDLWRSPARRS